jgi:hypothetical protein
MRYFKDIHSLRRFGASLLNKREDGLITAQEYRDLFYGINIMLKIFQQIYVESQLLPLQERLEQLEVDHGEV